MLQSKKEIVINKKRVHSCFFKEGTLLEVATKSLFVFKRSLRRRRRADVFGVPYEKKKGVDLFGARKLMCARGRTPARMCAHAG